MLTVVYTLIWDLLDTPRTEVTGSVKQGQQLAIAIYKEIPANGSFVKAEAIAAELKRKTRQVEEIFGLIKEPWDLKSSKNNKEGGYARL